MNRLPMCAAFTETDPNTKNTKTRKHRNMQDETKYVEGFVQLLPLVPLHKLVIFPHMPATFELAG